MIEAPRVSIYSRDSQRGNVLFLILIAVALFAALSYTVTQSTRSGGGDASAEKTKLNYAAVQAYVSGMRATITRMNINGTPIQDINFHTPLDFAGMSATDLATNVYSPKGGNYPYNDSFGAYSVNFSIQVTDIGTTDTSNANGDEIVFLMETNGADAFCREVNKKNDITGIPAYGQMDNVSTFGYSLNDAAALPAELNVASGKIEACFEDTTNGRFFYYNALVER